MTLEQIVKAIEKYVQHPNPSEEGICYEAYVNSRPVRFQIGLPKQSQTDTLNEVCDLYDGIDAVLEEANANDDCPPWRKPFDKKAYVEKYHAI